MAANAEDDEMDWLSFMQKHQPSAERLDISGPAAAAAAADRDPGDKGTLGGRGGAGAGVAVALEDMIPEVLLQHLTGRQDLAR